MNGDLTLVIGNKNYSSWSFRAWLALSLTGQTFREILVPLDQPETRAAILAHSPTGLVPLLRHGDLAVWDSLAIGEYLAETFPEAGLWPRDSRHRALARAVTAEMHSGFPALRAEFSMDMRRRRRVVPSQRAERDILRIQRIWAECLLTSGSTAFLFGEPGLADCFYAPVVSRFVTYGVALDHVAAAYVDRVTRWPLYRAWYEAAEKEPWDLGDHH